MDKETENKIQELQLLEQNLQNLMLQKQNFQGKLLETEHALNELKDLKGESYKIIGTIMVLKDNKELKEELDSEKDVLNLRIKNIEKQEDKIKEKMEELQKEVMKKLEKDDK
ncbi:MAG: prefoldin subunit [Nanoarchaeota archaeon]|nr:prefoldin subunit [Nanoarchaeota archaeon]